MLIEGKKVRLRPITMEDTPLIVKWRNTEEVRQNFIYKEVFTEEIHRNWMKNKVQTGRAVQYIIMDKEEQNRPVGSVYFRDIDNINMTAEYGIFIGEKSARGKGLGSETARLFTDFGMDVLGLQKIILRVITYNHSAIKSYIQAGYAQGGECRMVECSDGSLCEIMIMEKRRGKDDEKN